MGKSNGHPEVVRARWIGCSPAHWLMTTTCRLIVCIFGIASLVAAMQVSKRIRGRGTPDNPPNRFERISFERDPEASAEDVEDRPPPQTEYYRDASDFDHYLQRKPGCWFRRQSQSLSRLLPRLHLLLRPSVPRVSRVLRRIGFRNEDRCEGKCARIAAARVVVEEMEAAGAGHERRHRSVSTGRTPTANHTQMPRSPHRISQSRRHHHKEPARHARHRLAV